jgi:hypothetical protein
LFCLFSLPGSADLKGTSMKRNRATQLKPRNPFVAAARFRRAGAHALRDGSRQTAQMRLRKELLELKRQ